MPHKIKKIFYENLTFEKLLAAHQRARKGKATKNNVIQFEMNLENNLTNLLNQLRIGTYHIGAYRSFIILEPKKREIESLPYVDRIVHQWYVEEFIKPYILPKFIKDTYACIPDRGTHHAVDAVQHYMQIYHRKKEDFWVLKCDIRKFFYSIDRSVLFEILKKHIGDKALLRFTYHLLEDNRNGRSLGIPIGNYTSQFFANIYLNELDQYIKHELRIKYYVRYMDDFILLLDTKADCKFILEQIRSFLKSYLKLELNEKSRYYPCHMGINFCGYRIWPTHRLLRTNSKRKMKKKISKWNHLFHNGTLDYKRVLPTFNSWMGHISHCNSYKLKQHLLKKIDFLYETYEPFPLEENLTEINSIEEDITNDLNL